MEKKIDPKLMTKEMLEKALACETPEALVALGKENGVELTTEQAKKILDELENLDVKLSDEDMAKVAGGGVCWSDSCWSDFDRFKDNPECPRVSEFIWF